MDICESAKAQQALESCLWFNDLLGSGRVEEYTRGSGAQGEWVEGPMAKHYVVGQRSPFRFRMAKSKLSNEGECHLIWAVYCGNALNLYASKYINTVRASF